MNDQQPVPIRSRPHGGQEIAGFGRWLGDKGNVCAVALELASVKEFNEAIVNAIPSSILAFNRDLRLIYANDTFFEQWRHPRAALGQSLTELLSPEIVREERWEEMMQEVLATGQPIINRVMDHVSPTRGRTVIRFSLLRLRDRQAAAAEEMGGCPGAGLGCLNLRAGEAPPLNTWQGDKVLLVMDDITEQRAWQRQLVQSEKLAGLGQLSAGIAHELRTPLNAINVAAYCVADSLKDPNPDLEEMEECLTVIQRNVARAEKIITALMQFARPSEDQLVAVDINELLETTLAILNKSFADADVEVQTRLNGAPPVRCRPDTVKQALLNIIVNGVQAMPEGGRLTLTTFYNEPERMVCLEVTDTGQGIPPEHLEHIFQPFFTTKTTDQGTGLGLTIAQTAVEADGGRILVCSEVGRGTTFTIQLPAAA